MSYVFLQHYFLKINLYAKKVYCMRRHVLHISITRTHVKSSFSDVRNISTYQV